MLFSLNALKIHRHRKDFHSSGKMHTFDVYDCTLNILGLVDSYGYFFANLCENIVQYLENEALSKPSLNQEI